MELEEIAGAWVGEAEGDWVEGDVDGGRGGGGGWGSGAAGGECGEERYCGGGERGGEETRHGVGGWHGRRVEAMAKRGEEIFDEAMNRGRRRCVRACGTHGQET